MAKDITDRNDIVILVDAFYTKVNADELLAPVFRHLVWEHHMPIMYNFWATMLLGEMSYKGNPFEKHLHLNIQRKHFTQWLALFQETVDELFEGARATEIKDRARSIAGIFNTKWGFWNEFRFDCEEWAIIFILRLPLRLFHSFLSTALTNPEGNWKKKCR